MADVTIPIGEYVNRSTLPWDRLSLEQKFIELDRQRAALQHELQHVREERDWLRGLVGASFQDQERGSE